MWQDYKFLTSIDELCNDLSIEPAQKKIIAGGTDLLLEMERGLRPGITTLLDITRIPGLDMIREDENGQIHIGPLVTHNDVVASELIRSKAYPLLQACWQVGSPQIRNVGTVAGNLITGSPANDTITPLMGLGASVTLRSLRGERIVKLADFFKGVRKSVLQLDEVLVDVFFPGLDKDTRGIFVKSALRRAQAISVVNACVIVTQRNQTVERVIITMGAVAPTIIHASSVEEGLVGNELTEKTINDAAELVEKDLRPISDIRGSDQYRTYIMKAIIRKALSHISDNSLSDPVPDQAVLLRHDPFVPNAKWDGKEIITHINGKQFSFEKGINKNLLSLIREQALLTGTKEGCGEGECGACTVHINGKAVMSCLVPAPRAHQASITTIEGLSGDDQLTPLQKAFVDFGAVQCGFCTPGFIMSSSMLLKEKSKPDQDEIRQAITGNLCRCTGYYKIIQAIESASQTLGGE